MPHRRPCNCDDLPACRLCWLYANDPRYTALWSEPYQPSQSPTDVLRDDEIAELFAGENDATLIGNRIATLTTAIGIPPCGGCTMRKEWMNRAHAWLRSQLTNPDNKET